MKQDKPARGPLAGFVTERQIGSFNSHAKDYWDQMLATDYASQITHIRPQVFRMAAEQSLKHEVSEISIRGITVRFCIHIKYFYFYGKDLQKLT